MAKRRKKAKRAVRKTGHVPIKILERRVVKLNNLLKKRGGKHL